MPRPATSSADTWADIRADLYRYRADTSRKSLVAAFRAHPGFRLMVFKRLAMRWRHVLPLHLVLRLLYRLACTRRNIRIPLDLETGRGIYISHCFGIVINPECTLGDNVNISQNVTLGQTNRGDRKGSPTIGSRVYIGPGAVIAGKITIGDDALISANSLVTRDVESGTVVMGVPAKAVSTKGSEGYVHNLADPQ